MQKYIPVELFDFSKTQKKWKNSSFSHVANSSREQKMKKIRFSTRCKFLCVLDSFSSTLTFRMKYLISLLLLIVILTNIASMPHTQWVSIFPSIPVSIDSKLQLLHFFTKNVSNFSWNFDNFVQQNAWIHFKRNF